MAVDRKSALRLSHQEYHRGLMSKLNGELSNPADLQQYDRSQMRCDVPASISSRLVVVRNVRADMSSNPR
jgi:hypothetical protein